MRSMMSRGLNVHQVHELLLRLEEAGLTAESAQRVIDSKGNELAAKVVGLIQGGNSITASQKRAREIMGRNFFGVEEATKYFGVNPTSAQLLARSKIPFAEAVLEQVKDTHILVAVFPLSILEIRGKVRNRGLFYGQSWYDNEAFAKECGEVAWQLVRKIEVPGSTSKTWQEQLALIAKNEEVPTAQVMVYIITGHFLAAGERLFEHVWVRTSSLASDGRRVCLGSFDANGLFVDGLWAGRRRDNLGVASTRKF